VISDALLAKAACPVCLEAEGCPGCTVTPSHGGCLDYERRVRCPCGGPDKVSLVRGAKGLECPCCGANYPIEEGFLDLTPRLDLGERTAYADGEFRERIRVRDVEPLLSARVKADMMRRLLGPGPGDRILDLGCGPGKFALFTAVDGAHVTGLDLAPFFFPRALAGIDLALADLRRLPFRKASHEKAYTLDVLEHLDEEGVRDVLVEARRVLGGGGRLFVYTHAMESSWIARFQRLTNRLARRLGEAGLLDHEEGALKKSDHRNPIRSHEHFDALCAEAGLAVRERRYYNVVAKAVVEDLLLPIYKHRRARADPAPARPSGPALPAGRRPGRAVLALGGILTWILKLDVVFFGGVRTGPFFALLEPRR
jgi:ubiquinone/menaquinone biosynthesis C-methylase UbiE